jgi:hypothetical protein
MALGEHRQAVGRRVALARQERKIITEDVQRDPFDIPGGTLGGKLPVVRREHSEQVEKEGTLGSESWGDVEDREAGDHASTLYGEPRIEHEDILGSAMSFGTGASLHYMETTNLGKNDGLPLIEWPRVEEQLVDLQTHDDPQSPNRPTFWLTTLNGDGSAHVTSVGAMWHAGSCWFQTGERTRKAKNVARDARCTVSVATKAFDVVLAGEARLVREPKIVAEIAALWAKSGWPAEPDASGTGITAPFNAPALGPPPWFVYQVEPHTATAVGTSEATQGSTRWRF